MNEPWLSHMNEPLQYTAHSIALGVSRQAVVSGPETGERPNPTPLGLGVGTRQPPAHARRRQARDTSMRRWQAISLAPHRSASAGQGQPRCRRGGACKQGALMAPHLVEKRGVELHTHRHGHTAQIDTHATHTHSFLRPHMVSCLGHIGCYSSCHNTIPGAGRALIRVWHGRTH